MTIERCHDCKILLGPCDGSVMLRDCSGLEVHALCRQFRTRDCADCKVFVCTPAPVVESSVRVHFGPWNAGYPGLKAQLAAARLDVLAESADSNK